MSVKSRGASRPQRYVPKRECTALIAEIFDQLPAKDVQRASQYWRMLRDTIPRWEQAAKTFHSPHIIDRMIPMLSMLSENQLWSIEFAILCAMTDGRLSAIESSKMGWYFTEAMPPPADDEDLLVELYRNLHKRDQTSVIEQLKDRREFSMVPPCGERTTMDIDAFEYELIYTLRRLEHNHKVGVLRAVHRLAAENMPHTECGDDDDDSGYDGWMTPPKPPGRD